VANLDSSKKRIRSNERKRQRNVAVRTGVKTAIKKVEQAIAEGDLETAQANFSSAVSTMDSAVAKGIIKKNTISRKKSQLAKKINAIQTAA